MTNENDLIRRADAIEFINSGISLDTDADREYATEMLKNIPPAEAVQTDCTEFVNWLVEEVMDDENWELNAVALGEIICRKLAKLGLLKVKDGYYIRPSADAEESYLNAFYDGYNTATLALSAEAVTHGRLIDADALSEKLCETTIFIKDGEAFQRMINDAPTVSAEAVQGDLIIKGAKGIQDGLYNIKDGKLFKYKAKGGTVREYPIVSAEAVQGWIPFKKRPLTDEEKQEYPDWTYIFDCPLPDDEEEILLSNGKYVWTDTFINDGECYLDGGDDIDDGMAWMPLPAPYKGGDSE